MFYVGASGAREVESFASETEAIEARDAYNREAGQRTVTVALTEYLEGYPWRSMASKDTARFRLTGILDTANDRPLATITPAVAGKLYAARVAGVKPDTQRSELGYARRFFAWCIERGYVAANPFADVKPVGDKSRGKPQLRVDEARRFIQTALGDESSEATAVLMALLMGLRAHEVVERTVRDVDDGGRLLWIPKSKTRAGVRQIAIPGVLRERVIDLTAGKGPDDRLLSLTRHGLHYHVTRLAARAGVPRVTPHGLRGTFATLAVAASGGAVGAIARGFGHADGGETMRRHYLAPGTEQSANVVQLERLIGRCETGADSLHTSQTDGDR